MRQRRVFLSLLCLVLMVGCAAKRPVKPPIPNSINTFDSDTYRALSIAQASINSFKNDPAFPGIVAKHPQVKTILNQCIMDYDAANTLYQVWKASNGATPQAPVQAAVDKMNSDVSQLAAGGGQ